MVPTIKNYQYFRVVKTFTLNNVQLAYIWNEKTDTDYIYPVSRLSDSLIVFANLESRENYKIGPSSGGMLLRIINNEF